ncbi:UDP-N-acetylmuramoyl-tripeptide--D-alanyl-D-alanine ligase [Acetobacter lambici]|uniref:UDP-N-acetylmuramoyl-tripeptide--D-alanyl-D-alanine ligase n=1 Tax=Acetobacter lambici TaxID=1332824 RepID=A0ABT1F0F5_9PROT|nr:UDP-N-acetylmuramoyl-tripeptide--D-alanyl-D-alanine ligase [Acetobacter lambici]MCP1242448.1 UDP-N-acetylmuramoyl-tripeptide--D-alanyl-D-alanine ligase [Acetobacter lambici]MCP1258687.1 UDP-N-acetylmuramoyl-tripeptide--D-alanyl-D-alanine ligase [Acetobacter lambici]NHO56928.1 UDP-N-acetylmuramoyl-tripeptide--D-alanyl-D-alanine ligase [Acetobacter lambici]
MSTLWTRTELAEATSGHFLSGAEHTAAHTTPGKAVFDKHTPESPAPHAGVSGISIDTRTLQPGDLFIALKGDTSDGHTHVQAALDKGAACAMVHAAGGLSDPRVLVVADTMVGLQQLARAARARFTGKVVAVTGSVGKTTTKEMLRLCLGANGATHAAEASYNNHWGVPLTLARLPRHAAFCISEIGMNHPGEILPLARMVRPDVAVITTIGSAHLGHMGSLDAIAAEKASIISTLPAHGVAVVPDDAHGAAFFALAAQQAHATLWTTGANPASTAHMTNMRSGADGTHFTAHIAGATLHVHVPAPGMHLARNALAALAACAALGADLPRAAAALEDFAPGKGRGALSHIAGGTITLLDESYNASSASIRAALDVLHHLPATRRIAILGDMRELGEFSTVEHAALAQPAAASADLVFCCGPYMKTLFDALPPARQGAWADNAASLAPLACAALRGGDAVLVKGSLGSRMRDVMTALQTLNAVEPS